MDSGEGQWGLTSEGYMVVSQALISAVGGGSLRSVLVLGWCLHLQDEDQRQGFWCSSLEGAVAGSRAMLSLALCLQCAFDCSVPSDED